MSNILVIDDDKSFRVALSRSLRLAGHEVREACDATEAMLSLTERNADLILTDVLMPGRDGLEIIRAVRIRWPSSKIIAMSGGGFFAAELYTDLSVKLGAAHALEKPFSSQHLLATVEAVMK